MFESRFESKNGLTDVWKLFLKLFISDSRKISLSLEKVEFDCCEYENEKDTITNNNMNILLLTFLVSFLNYNKRYSYNS